MTSRPSLVFLHECGLLKHLELVFMFHCHILSLEAIPMVTNSSADLHVLAIPFPVGSKLDLLGAKKSNLPQKCVRVCVALTPNNIN